MNYKDKCQSQVVMTQSLRFEDSAQDINAANRHKGWDNDRWRKAEDELLQRQLPVDCGHEDCPALTRSDNIPIELKIYRVSYSE